MPEPNQLRADAIDRKRQAQQQSTHNERQIKRPRNLGNSTPSGPERRPVREPGKTPGLESVGLGLLSAHPRPSHLAEASTGPLIIDLTGDDDGDVVMGQAQNELPTRVSDRLSLSPTKADTDTAPLTPTPVLAEIHNIPYDTCFGLVSKIPAAAMHESSLLTRGQIETPPMMIKSSGEADTDWFPVKIETSGVALNVLTSDSVNHLGTAISKEAMAICALAKKHSLVLSATLVIPDARRRTQYIQATLRLVVYGHISEKQVVAKDLSDNGLYLQHPSLSECDSRVPYFNPQYLLRPGASMPELESLPISSQSRERSYHMLGDSLDEVEKSRLLQIFESAHDPDVAFGIHQSSRLQSTLKEYVFFSFSLFFFFVSLLLFLCSLFLWSFRGLRFYGPCVHVSSCLVAIHLTLH